MPVRRSPVKEDPDVFYRSLITDNKINIPRKVVSRFNWAAPMELKLTVSGDKLIIEKAGDAE